VLLPLTCALIVAGAIRGRLARAILELPGIYVIGGMCYSIYLLHFGIIRLIGEAITSGVDVSSPALDLWTSTFVLTALCLLASGVYFVLIERPCMRPDWVDPSRGRGRRYARRRLRSRRYDQFVRR
jgi:peptidoglycan/LPS O-acetylase OafA/YrhL